ncbi:MAG: hypothetical protein RXR08_13675, partial [Sulfolobaceae archaeon]
MSTFSTEITTAFGTLLVSILVYLLTTFIQQRTKKNNTLRLIGTVYVPVRYFIRVRFIDMVANVLFLTVMFLLILSLFLDFILGSDSGYLIKIIIFILFISAMLLYYVHFNFLVKRDQIIRELIDESSAYSTVDIDSLNPRWKALYWGTLVLAVRFFLLIFIAVFSTTLALFFLNKGFTVLDYVLIGVYIISFFLSLGLAMFLHFISLRSNNKRLKVSFFDTSDEIESRSFNLIKELSLCLCIVDDNGNKHCGSLEGITYNVLIRDMDGILVGIPYDHVYRVEEC